MLRTPAFRVLPTRALASGTTKKKAKKQQKKTAVAQEVKMVPFIPPELTKETQQFFRNQPRLKALLELVFSPREPQETEDDMLEYEEARAEFETVSARARGIYEAHEARAERKMWRAVQQLPEDLHNEAIASKPDKIPEALLFHQRHRVEIFNGLHDLEKRHLQCFQNLLHVRYPHSDEKKRNPHRFLIPENQVVSRQKEAAMAKKKIKKV
mmetsp:Transcript_76934/g.120243  ORF Transcript_76934/g.120243 Transcript_76934/m.120243 type:complete len:211 (-) Transcript_76934:40-672(-)